MPMRRKNFENCSLIVGRFQPFHNGHMEVIRKCSNEWDRFVIGIGSAQYSHEIENPFTAGERYLMIDESLRDEGIDNYFIIPIEDLNRYSVWVPHVISMSPPFSVVYSNNHLTKRLFNEWGYEVRDTPPYSRSIYSGTAVRKMIAEDGDWTSCVPKAVVDVIEDIDGVNRIKAIQRDF